MAATPAPATVDTVRQIICGKCDICSEKSLTLDAHLLDELGIDSLDMVEIDMCVNKQFGIKMGPDRGATFNNTMTFGEYCCLIDSKAA